MRAWSAWREKLRSRREEAALRRRAIPDDLWKRTLVRFPFLQRRDDPGAKELRRLTSLFLDQKEFSAAGGMKLSDAIAVSIAAQAVLPVLRLGLERYQGFVGVVVHPDQVLARREVTDEAGVVHEYDEPLAGEAQQGGPVMLSWRDVRAAGHGPGGAYNVVIHEFAHVLDLAGCLPGDASASAFENQTGVRQAQLAISLQAFAARLESGQSSVMDAYGAESAEEFFAVASEAFFVHPQGLADEDAALYGWLSRFYKQDPAAEQPDRSNRR
jgi:MtfA peptidase